MKNTEKILVLFHLIRDKELRAALIQSEKKWEKHTFFEEDMDTVEYLLWEVCKEVHLNNKGTVARLTCNIILERREDYVNAKDMAKAHSLLDEFFDIDKKNLRKTKPQCDAIIKDRLMQVSRLIIQAKLSAVSSTEAVSSLINDVKNDIIDSLEEDKSLPDTPFMDVDRFVENTPREPTGAMPFDIVTGGGILLRTVTLVMAPTGGGKTTLSSQILTNKARRKQHCLLCTYEQPTQGDVTERICSNMLDTSVNILRSKQVKEWPQAVQAKYKVQKEMFGEYIHVEDMSKGLKGTGGVDDIKQLIQRMQEASIMPKVIIIDWFLPMLRRYLTANSIPLTSEYVRNYAGVFIDDLNQLAKDKDVSFIIFHQLNTQVARASSKYKPVVTDAMEIKSLGYLCDDVVLIGNRNKVNNIAWMLTDKARRGAPQELLVKLNGEFARFENAQDDYILDRHGNFMEKNARVPSEEYVQEDTTDGFSSMYMG